MQAGAEKALAAFQQRYSPEKPSYLRTHGSPLEQVRFRAGVPSANRQSSTRIDSAQGVSDIAAGSCSVAVMSEHTSCIQSCSGFLVACMRTYNTELSTTAIRTFRSATTDLQQLIQK